MRHAPRTVDEGREVDRFRAAWFSHILSTEPADRKRAEEGVRLTYRTAGVPEPELFLWFDGLLEAALAAEQLSGGAERNWLLPSTALRYRKRVQQTLRHTLGVRTWQQVIKAVGRSHESRRMEQREIPNPSPFGRKTLTVAIAVPVSDSLQAGLAPHDPLDDRIAGESQAMKDLRRELDTAGRKLFEQQRLRSAALIGRGPSGHSSLDIHSPLFRREYPYGFLAMHERAGSLRYQGLWTSAQTCAAWWPFARAAVLADRPQSLSVNSEMELQNEAGPAIVYRTGLAL